ncbi:hypothetical protein FACS1894204_06030 [Synergistales bacterium]|nr:hypothetical protein FACS1894204_06030 [Synergistales bacterium]
MPKIKNLQDLRQIKESAAKQLASRQEGKTSETDGSKVSNTAAGKAK